MDAINARTRSIVFGGGGTAGSVTPLLAVAEQLQRRRAARCVFVGTARGPERTLVRAAGFAFVAIPAGKLRRYRSWSNVVDVFRAAAGLVASVRLLRREKPDVVVGAGSYVSVPLGWAARALGIPVLIHQPDVLPGLANRLLARFAQTITVTFPQVQKRFPAGRTIVTGNPVRAAVVAGDRERGRARFSVPPGRPVVLCLGGGTGALTLNRLIASAAPAISSRASLIHVTGVGKAPAVEPVAGYQPVAFLTTDLPDVLAAADVVVSRAGLGTLSELAALRKPVIVVPLPDSHQEANAKYLAEAQAALILDQSTLTPDGVVAAVRTLLDDRVQRTSLGTRLHDLIPNGTASVANEVLTLTKRAPV
ncbi:MAG: undecaprenyldiphospho-muramoylpentapeptide beta-N-acetylglucosaminyltransferase [Candidatus Kerfeldbacteria bacterium]|nr:undecaprenyldiphospho-muramoylpentapeptide beta-N-acetylglucosaminyltransferase [Candidatus Kerfeldbacteria bacterium]